MRRCCSFISSQKMPFILEPEKLLKFPSINNKRKRYPKKISSLTCKLQVVTPGLYNVKKSCHELWTFSNFLKNVLEHRNVSKLIQHLIKSKDP